ncbi:MAG TPA: glycosyltransferase family 4 protein [Dehalococcoidia bacterium]|nr:glycosyltransferase family 4 protein [Dehalococcoidia bacterium]
MYAPPARPTGRRPLHVAMLGMRGIPANYGGLETVAEEVAARVVERGHRVTAYCRAHNAAYHDAVYRGIRRVELPSLNRKHLDTPSHTAAASVHALIRRADVVHVFGVGNAPWLPLLRLAGRGTVISVDGMDWRRRKWGRAARALLERSSHLAIRASGACITDSREVARWYQERYGRQPHYIAHGVDMREIAGRGALATYHLEERGYLLFVGRITPEKGLHHLIEAYKGLDTDKALVIVGDGSTDGEYWKSLHLRATGFDNVRLLGPVYGEPVRELFANAYVYVQPSEIEGTALSLVEAMGYGNCVLVSDIPENVETVGPAGITFQIADPVASLRDRLARLIAAPELVGCHRAKSLDYAREHFSWERVTDAHEDLYYQVSRIG